MPDHSFQMITYLASKVKLDFRKCFVPAGYKIYYGHLRYETKWCKFLKLVAYRTFLRTLLPVIICFPDSMNPFPIPQSLV